MTTFDRLMEPVLPILQEIEQERVPHFNETYSWPLFVRVLVYHFTMGYQSMRELVTGLRHADAALALPALPRSTVSQMFTRFDSDLLHRALVRLLAILPLPENPELALLGTIYLVDGSYFPTLHQVLWKSCKDVARSVKLHFIFDATRMVPASFIIDAATSSERGALLAQLRKGVTYVLDRGYMEFTLFLDILKAQSSVVMRAYRNLIVETVEELPVTLPDAVTASWTTVRDRLVTSPHPDMEGVVFRLVECTIGQTIYRLMTDRTDISTFQVILLYAYRWQIELIFRALKWTMNGVYVITEHEEGIHSFFAALFLTALLHIHLKRDCLAQEGHVPPLSAEPPDVSEGYVQISADCARTTTHLAIARFMARVNTKLALFWKIPKHWLKALAANLHRPFTLDIVRALNEHALTPF
jgi:DDE family transposase